MRTRLESPYVVAALCAGLFLLAVAFHGIPSLRHDWAWSASRSLFVSTAWANIGGWTPGGIGNPRPYPTDYLVAAFNAFAVLIFGNYVSFVLFVALVAFAVAYAAVAMAAAVGSQERSTLLAAGLFALFNPWVYSKIVAGHVTMILAFAGLSLLLREVLFRGRRPWHAAVWTIVTASQIQVFLLALALVAIASVRHPKLRLAVLSAFVVASPTIVGIAFNTTALLSTPYTTSWQLNNSVDPSGVLFLEGYAANYASALPLICQIGMGAIVLAAVAGAIFGPAPMRWIALAGAFTALIATGLKGPVALPYQFAVTHVPETAVYRELYDVLGGVAIVYGVLASASSARSTIARAVFFGGALLLVLSWAVAPPDLFWVPRSAMPRADVASATGSRVAFMPPFQPFTFDRRGSGLDPDDAMYPGGVSVLNGNAFSYPENAALARYALFGKAEALKALSVSDVIARPWLQTDLNALQGQAALPVPRYAATNASSAVLTGWLPKLTLFREPCIDSDPTRLDDGCIFFGDAPRSEGADLPARWRSLPSVDIVAPTRPDLNAGEGWIDTRLVFIAEPELAQGVGGAFTTSRVPLALPAREYVLIWVKGRLQNQDRRLISDTTRGYRWVRMPAGTSAVVCTGECVVSAKASTIEAKSIHPVDPPTALGIDEITPWMGIAHIATSSPSVLRYNVRYNPRWVALLNGRALPHFRIDTIVNGWLLPSAADGNVLLVEYVAAIQFFLEVIGLAWALFIAYNAFVRAEEEAAA